MKTPWRKMTNVVYLVAVAIATVILLAPSALLATSTGLNNIPTADVPGDREVVLQTFSNFGSDRGPKYFAGLKTGLLLSNDSDIRFEAGIDSSVGPGGAGPAVFQFKLSAAPGKGATKLAVGTANVALTGNSRDRTGHPFTFGVVTHDFELARITAGYGFQKSNDAAFLGLDKRLAVAGTELQLRGDVIETEGGSDQTGSLGFLWVFHSHLALEAWGSQEFDGGTPVWTLKLNIAHSFKE